MCLRDEILNLVRTSLSSGYGQLKKINVPPFYIMPAIAVVPGTYCGLKVDEQTRVLRSTDDPIEGLFAAGEIMGGFHGKNFVTGTGLGKALAFGESQEKTLAYENDLLRLFLRIVTLFIGFFCRSYSVGSHRLSAPTEFIKELIRDSVEEINKILEPRHSLIVKEMTESEMKTAILQHELDLFISSSAFIAKWLGAEQEILFQ